MTTDTDRELLEWAANATEIELRFSPDGLPRNCTNCHPAMNIYAAAVWSPLTDDGDALRLAVKLRLEIAPLGNGMVDVCKPGTEPFVCACETGDPYDATRRAIVRAAAEIGKAMK